MEHDSKKVSPEIRTFERSIYLSPKNSIDSETAGMMEYEMSQEFIPQACNSASKRESLPTDACTGHSITNSPAI